MTPLIAFALAAAMQPGETGADWVELGSNGERSAHVDRASAEREGGIARFWVRFTFPCPQQGGWQVLFAQMEIDCPAHTARPRRLITRRPDGRVVDDINVPLAMQPFASIEADSNGEAMYAVLCRAEGAAI